MFSIINKIESGWILMSENGDTNFVTQSEYEKLIELNKIYNKAQLEISSSKEQILISFLDKLNFKCNDIDIQNTINELFWDLL